MVGWVNKYNNESLKDFFTFIIGIIHRKILTYCKCNKTNYLAMKNKQNNEFLSFLFYIMSHIV